MDNFANALAAAALARSLGREGRISRAEIADWQPLLDYCQDLLHYTRSAPQFQHGLSPRAGLALLRAARAWALLDGRDAVIPEDLQAVVPTTVTHRLQFSADIPAVERQSVAEHLLEAVPIP